MKTQGGFDANTLQSNCESPLINGYIDCGAIVNAVWEKDTGKCIKPIVNASFDLVMESPVVTFSISNSVTSDIKQTITIQDENGVHEFELKNPNITHYTNGVLDKQKPKYELPDPTSRHYKFAKYCESIGYPDIQCKRGYVVIPNWFDGDDYRISNDPHHE